MNIQRYIMPVIVAAGIHGSLVFFSSERNPPPPTPPRESPVVYPDMPRMEMAPEEVPASAAEGGGGVSELPPSIPEPPRELMKEDIFVINVQERVETIKPVTDLPTIPKEIGPPGDSSHLRKGPPGIFNTAGLDRAPRATVQPPPPYPSTMSNSGISGSVTVEFIVDPTGRVVSAEAVKWTHREFVDPAVRSVLRWRFEPGTVEGRKVTFRMAVPIEFNAER